MVFKVDVDSGLCRFKDVSTGVRHRKGENPTYLGVTKFPGEDVTRDPGESRLVPVEKTIEERKDVIVQRG